MRQFVTDFKNALPEGTQKGLVALVSAMKAAGLIPTHNDMSLALEELLPALQASRGRKPSWSVPSFEGRSSSRDLNTLLGNIYLDLSALYRQISLSASTIAQQDAASTELLGDVDAQTKKVAEDLAKHRFLRKTDDWNDLRICAFRDGRNYFNGRSKAVLDPETQTLRLSEQRYTSPTSGRGVTAPLVEVEDLSSNESVVSRSFLPANAADPRHDTFWSHVVLSDDPLITSYNGTEYDGAIVQLTITLPGTYKINEIGVLPFSNFPLRILDVRYHAETGDSTAPLFLQVPGFSQGAQSLLWSEFRFPPVTASQIRVVLNQPTYTIKNLLVKRSDIAYAALWDQLLDSYYEDHVSDIADDISVRAEVDSSFKRLANAISTYEGNRQALHSRSSNSVAPEQQNVMVDIRAFLETMGGGISEPDVLETFKHVLRLLPGEFDSAIADGIDRDEYIRIKKLEYTVGAFSITAKNSIFEPIGYYESPKYQTPSDVLKVGLETIEVHQTLVDNSGVHYEATSIDYDVELAPNLRFPIIPSNYGNRIECEVLTVDTTTGGSRLRFPSAVNLIVRKDKEPTTNYTIDANRKDIVIGDAQESSLYTAEYSVDPALLSAGIIGSSGLDIDALVNSRPITKPDEFDGTTPSATIHLNALPFINKEIVNLTFQNDPRWLRPDDRSARWEWIPGNVPMFSDGRSFGRTQNQLGSSITPSSTDMDLSNANNFPAQGYVILTSVVNQGVVERIKYTSKAGNKLENLSRAQDGTIAGTWGAGTLVEYDGAEFYEPIIVLVGGVRAANYTDYVSGYNNAFPITNPGDANQQYFYVHNGLTLYFNRVIPEDTTIKVYYRTLAQYVKLIAMLKSGQAVLPRITPELKSFKLKLLTSRG